MKRYQECGRIEKAYRWLRHMPLAYLSFCWWLVKWPFTGFARDEDYSPTRMDWLSSMWTIHVSMAQGKMEYYVTWEEFKEKFGLFDPE